jgi:hypothetical protein
MAKLNTTASNLEIKTNKVTSTGAPLNTWTDTNYTSAKTLTSAFNSLINTVHPISSFYETADASFNPNIAWSGRNEVWELVSSIPERIYLNSQILHPGTSGSGNVTKTNICGAYRTDLFDPFYYQLVKAGYHIEFRFTAVATTNNNNPIHFYLNNVDLGNMNTWSGTAFRRLWTSSFIKLSDITQTPAAGYATAGYTFAYECITSVGWHTFQFWDLTAHAYLVSDTPIYRWKRIA